jgi:hypothetical protein
MPDANYLAWILRADTPLKLEKYKRKILSFLHSVKAVRFASII